MLHVVYFHLILLTASLLVPPRSSHVISGHRLGSFGENARDGVGSSCRVSCPEFSLIVVFWLDLTLWTFHLPSTVKVTLPASPWNVDWTFRESGLEMIG